MLSVLKFFRDLLVKFFEASEKPEHKVPTPKPTPKDEDNSAWVPDKYEEEYKKMYHSCIVRPGNESRIKWYVDMVRKDKERYEKVAKKFNMPWQVVGIINGLEGGFNFNAYLGNGERIIGTGKVSKLVPKDRGPFSTWEQGAIDALNNDKTKSVPNWTLAETLYYFERFNGMGYRGKRDKNGALVYSPYLWGLSNHHLYGKYVRDGVYSPSATTKQVGAALIMRYLGMFS